MPVTRAVSGRLAARSPSRATPGAFKRLVEARVRAAQEGLRAAGIDADVHVGWAPDHLAVLIRCSVLRDGAPDLVAREHAAFAGGYLLSALADLGARPQRPANARHLLVPLPGPSGGPPANVHPGGPGGRGSRTPRATRPPA
jgi:hypothetical protein